MRAFECHGFAGGVFPGSLPGSKTSISHGTSASAPCHGGKVRFVKAFSTQLPVGFPL